MAHGSSGISFSISSIARIWSAAGSPGSRTRPGVRLNAAGRSFGGWRRTARPFGPEDQSSILIMRLPTAYRPRMSGTARFTPEYSRVSRCSARRRYSSASTSVRLRIGASSISWLINGVACPSLGYLAFERGTFIPDRCGRYVAGRNILPPSGSSCHECHVTHDADATTIAMQATLHLMGDPAGAVRFPNIDRTLLDG
jgi:hypothetical protein